MANESCGRSTLPDCLACPVTPTRLRRLETLKYFIRVHALRPEYGKRTGFTGPARSAARAAACSLYPSHCASALPRKGF